MSGTGGASSRTAAMAEIDLDREVEELARLIEEHGPTDLEQLARLAHARGWGPGRFRRALQAAVGEGRVVLLSPGSYGPPVRV
jgi:hypothetical protein